MKKVLLFTDCLGAGGAQRQLVGLALQLHKRGYSVKVCTYYNLDFYKKELDVYNIPNVVIPGADNTKMRIMVISRYFKKESPDWIIAYQETPSLVAALAKVTGGKYKLIVSERNTTQVLTLRDRIRFFLYHWADAIVSNSFSQEYFLINRYKWMIPKLITIPNFVDTDKFPFIKREKHSILEIIVVATIRPSKNTKGFIHATKIIHDRGYDIRVSWFGKSDLFHNYYKECEQLIKANGLDKHFYLLEKTKNIFEQYSKADILCLPSFYEGTPNVICEAMSTGLPVICSNVCDNGRYVHPGINGWLFDPNDYIDIANCIERVIKLSVFSYESWQNKCRSIAIDSFSIEKFVQSYLAILS